jgi:type IV fimbrial biogenesis protein FimT
VNRRKPRGFTLIELLIAIAIAAILLVLAVPGYISFIADAEVGSAASTLADGLRFAQAEAIKRNANIEFVLDPTTGTGKWTVQLVGGGTLKAGQFGEGSRRVVFTAFPAGRTTITFNSFGQVEASNAAPPLLPFEYVGAASPDGTRALRVLAPTIVPGVAARSGVKICDPGPQYPWPDPKGCPPVGG